MARACRQSYGPSRQTQRSEPSCQGFIGCLSAGCPLCGRTVPRMPREQHADLPIGGANDPFGDTDDAPAEMGLPEQRGGVVPVGDPPTDYWLGRHEDSVTNAWLIDRGGVPTVQIELASGGWIEYPSLDPVLPIAGASVLLCDRGMGAANPEVTIDGRRRYIPVRDPEGRRFIGVWEGYVNALGMSIDEVATRTSSGILLTLPLEAFRVAGERGWFLVSLHRCTDGSGRHAVLGAGELDWELVGFVSLSPETSARLAAETVSRFGDAPSKGLAS